MVVKHLWKSLIDNQKLSAKICTIASFSAVFYRGILLEKTKWRKKRG